MLDLGCGTGATTRAALSVVDPLGEVIGVDGSPEMVAVAQANTADPRARFLAGAAEAVAQVIDGPFDGALCNAAFWQFPDPDRVWEALGTLLAPGAPFAFNVPGARRAESGPAQAFQVALARAIERPTGRPYVQTARRVDLGRTVERAHAAGLVEEVHQVRTWVGSQGALIQLMRIPAMRAPIGSGLSENEVLAAIDEAAGRVDPERQVEVDWVYLRYRRAT